MGLRRDDIASLPALRAARQQDDQRLAIAAEVEPIAGPKSRRRSSTPPPTPLTSDILPSDSCTKALATLALVTESSPSSQRRIGRRPEESR
jgi:hypothetical protein